MIISSIRLGLCCAIFRRLFVGFILASSVTSAQATDAHAVERESIETWRATAVDLNSYFGPSGSTRPLNLQVDGTVPTIQPKDWTERSSSSSYAAVLSPPKIPALRIERRALPPAATTIASIPASITTDALSEFDAIELLKWGTAFVALTALLVIGYRSFSSYARLPQAGPRMQRWFHNFEAMKNGCTAELRPVGYAFALLGQFAWSLAALAASHFGRLAVRQCRRLGFYFSQNGLKVAQQSLIQLTSALSQEIRGWLAQSWTGRLKMTGRLVAHVWSRCERGLASVARPLVAAHRASWTRRGRWVMRSLHYSVTYIAILTMVVPIYPERASAITLTWDANGATAGTGGTGTWGTANLWHNGTTFQTWANNNDAVLGGAAGTVTIGASYTVNSLSIQTNNYIVAGNATSRLLSFTAANTGIAVGAGMAATISATLSGANNFAKTGDGTLTISGSVNSFTGGLRIDAGIVRLGHAGALNSTTPQALTFGAASTGKLQLNGFSVTSANLATNATPGTVVIENGHATTAATLTVRSTANSVFAGVLQNGAAATLGLTKVGSSTLTLGGVNTYTGGTSINDGVLQLNSATGSLVGNLAVASIFRFDNVGAVAATDVNLGGSSTLTFNNGDATILSQRTADQNTTLTFNTFSRSTGATGDFTVAGTNSSASGNKVAFTTAPTTGQSLNGGLYFGGSDFVAYDAGGFVRALNYGGDANALNVVGGGSLGSVSNKDVRLTGTITAQGTETLRSLKIDGTFNLTQTAAANLDLTGGGLIKAGSGAATISGGTLQAGGGTGELVVRAVAAGDELIVSSAISAAALTKSGAGKLTLGGSNSIGAGVVINGGTLKVGNAAALSSANSVTFGTATSGTLQLDGNTLTIGGLATNAVNAGTTFVENGHASAPAVLTVNLASGTNTFAGTIRDGAAGTMALVKSGAGVLQLRGATNAYTGGTTLNGGTLDFTTGALGTSGAITFTGNSTLTWGGTTTSDLSGRLVLSNGVTATFDTGANAVIFASAIGGGTSASITKLGSSGTLTLNGLNNFTGQTVISGGTIAVNTLKDVGGGNSSLGAPTTVSAGTIRIGGGTTAGGLNVTAAGQTTDRVIDLAGTTGGAVLTHAASGLVKFTSDFTATGAGAKNLSLAGNTGSGEIAGKIVDNTLTNRTSIVKSGSGTWTLSNVANTFTGVTSIAGGTLAAASIKDVGTVSSLGAPLLAQATIGIGSTTTGGALTYIGSGDTTSRVINLAGTTGGATLTQAGTGTLKFTSAFTAGGAGIKTLTLAGSTTGVGEIAASIVNNSGTNTTSVSKSGSGKWILSGANLYTGTTNIAASGGILQFAKLNSFYNSSGTVSGVNAAKLTVNSGGTAAFNVGAASGEFAGADLDTLRSTAVFNAGSRLGIDTTNDPNGQFDYSSNLSGNAGLEKLGTGTLTLNPSVGNSYSGATVVRAGTLQLATRSALYNSTPASWTATNIIVDSGAVLALNVGGAGEFIDTDIQTISALGTGSGGFQNGSYLGIDTTNAGGTFTYSLGLSNLNSVGLIKLGSGILEIGGVNSLTGGTIVLGGSVQLAPGSSVNVSSGVFNVASGSQFNLAATSSVTAGTVENSGTFDLDGTVNGNFTNKVGGMLMSSGTITGKLTNETGAFFSPGNSPGESTSGSALLAAASTFQFEINDATGIAGPDNTLNQTGWDLLSVSGLLELGTLSNKITAASKIIIDFDTWAPALPSAGAVGDMINWVSTAGNGNPSDLNYTNEWQFLTFGSLSINGAAWTQDGWLNDFFTVNTSGFTNAGVTGFGVYKQGNSLYLAATPEPSTLVIWSLLGAGACGWRRRVGRAALPTAEAAVEA